MAAVPAAAPGGASSQAMVMALGHGLAAEADCAQALLVIGVHREELAFGECVAARLAECDALRRLDVLRITEGISGQRPRFDQRFHYEILHRALYRQIQKAAGRYRLLIDLHRGEDDEGPCADVISGDSRLLGCVRERTGEAAECPSRPHEAAVRTVQLTGDGRDAHQGVMAGRTVIPQELWNSTDVLFVGVEVYLPTPGSGSQRDWEFSARLIEEIIRCSRGLERGRGLGHRDP